MSPSNEPFGTPQADVLIDVSAVSLEFPTPHGSVEALVEVDMSARRHALTVVAGPSGSGKSSLLMVIAAAHHPTSGRVAVDGIEITSLSRRQRRRWRRAHLGIALPQPSDNLTDDLDAIGNLLWAGSLRPAPPTADGAAAILEAFDLSHVATSSIAQLSGGEQMRLGVACAAAGDPTLLVADEPTASLDAEAARRLIASMHQITRRGMSVLVATHDPALVDAADAVIELEHGRLR